MNTIKKLADADALHRGVKMAMDSGEVESQEEAYALFATYRASVCVGSEVRTSRAHQAAVLSLVNAGRRCLLGGVRVCGELDAPLLMPSFFGGATLAQAITAMGGIVDDAPDDATVILVGSATAPARATVILRLTFNAWAGGVSPVERAIILAERSGDVLGAILAAGIALSEVFQWLRERGRAAHRICGLSAWSPGSDWTKEADLPALAFGPSRVWVLGLGHLGQAFLWALALWTYGASEPVHVLLHDFDQLTEANDSTSLLVDKSMKGMKTRAVARMLEAIGVCTRVVERPFNGSEQVQGEDPTVAFCGVDNGPTRALVDQAGFALVIDAGLGNGPREYNALRLHTFPATRPAAFYWPTEDAKEARIDAKAYQDLGRKGVDACGLVQLATRSVGVPFVGLVAATLAHAEIARTLLGAHRLELLDLSLRDPSNVSVIRLATNEIRNFGFVMLPAS